MDSSQQVEEVLVELHLVVVLLAQLLDPVRLVQLDVLLVLLELLVLREHVLQGDAVLD